MLVMGVVAVPKDFQIPGENMVAIAGEVGENIFGMREENRLQLMCETPWSSY